MRRRRWKWIALAVVAALVVGGYAVSKLRSTDTERTHTYETAVVDRGPIRARVTATGTVNPVVQVQVGSQVSGTILTLGADFNSVVEPGQMIAQIDPRLFEAALAQAQANLLAARANRHRLDAQLVDARRQLARNRELFAKQLIAKATVETNETGAEVAVAQLEQAAASEAQARAAVDTAKLNLAFTTIRSPIRGTVITRNVDVGQTVAASFAAPTLFVIGEDLTKMVVDTNIAEADIGVLSPGMTVTFTVDAYRSKVFTGTIRQLRMSPQTVQNVVTYDAVIDVANPELRLRPGMTANLDIVYAERADVVRVPNAAVRFRAPAALAGKPPAHGRKTVWVLRAGQPIQTEVTLGVADDSFTEVTSGLAPGDAVITEMPDVHEPSRVGRML